MLMLFKDIVIAKRTSIESDFFINGCIKTKVITGFLNKIQKNLLNNFIFMLYGITAILRLFGIGFSSQISKGLIFLKIGLSVLIKIKIPKNIKVCIKIDERKKPNIIWIFSNIQSSVNSFTKTIQKYKNLSIFARKRITGILQVNELEQFRFKK